MSGSVDSLRPPLAVRLLPGPVRAVARHAWGTFRYSPWPVKVMLVIIVIGGPAAVGTWFGVRTVRNQRFAKQLTGWKEFEDAVRAGDEAKMQAALDRVLAASPAEPTALARKRALETGEADPADQPMVVLSLRRHLRANRMADAAREARKRLAAEKADWLSRCVVAADLLQKGDKAGAAAELDQLPPPNTPNAQLDPNGLMFAMKLFRATDKDPAPLRLFAQGVILPILKAPNTAQLPAGEKVGLVECYADSFDPASDRPQPTRVAEGWAAAAQLADGALDEATETKNGPVLARLGRVGGPLEAGLEGLRRGGQVTAEQYAQLAGDLRDRTRKAWEGARAADPANAEAARGLAGLLLRSLRDAPPADRPRLYDQARGVLVAALQAKADDPELAQMFSRLLAAEGRPLEAAQFLIGLAREHPDRPVWWALAAEAAVAANRREVALEAITQLRAKEPDNVWAARTEARLWVEAGASDRALLSLARLGEPALLRDPAAAYTYARALAETNSGDKLAQFLGAVATSEQPPAAAAVGRGLADAVKLPPAELMAHAARLLERFPDQPDLLRVQAEAAYRAAETGEPMWEVGRVRAAVRAVEQALLKAPDDPDLLVALGWLRLSGENNPAAASQALAPLRRAADDPGRTARQLEVLGAVALATNDVPAATRHLERAARGDPPAGVHALLARVYHVAGQPAKARASLDAARSRPRGPREQADYLVAAKLVAP